MAEVSVFEAQTAEQVAAKMADLIATAEKSGMRTKPGSIQAAQSFNRESELWALLAANGKNIPTGQAWAELTNEEKLAFFPNGTRIEYSVAATVVNIKEAAAKASLPTFAANAEGKRARVGETVVGERQIGDAVLTQQVTVSLKIGENVVTGRMASGFANDILNGARAKIVVASIGQTATTAGQAPVLWVEA